MQTGPSHYVHLSSNNKVSRDMRTQASWRIRPMRVPAERPAEYTRLLTTTQL
jgi:hypothetical protein